MLTVREFEIIHKILNEKESIRIKDLSEEFNVSIRTIKYNLNNVRSWFEDNHIELFSQPNRGIWIECDEEKRNRTKNLLIDLKRNQLFPNQNFRINKFLIRLMIQDEYVTASEIADYLKVSRNTIINDIGDMEKALQPWLIELEKKNRFGYRLKGKEIHVRLLSENLIRKNLTNEDLYRMNNRLKEDNDSDDKLMLDAPYVDIYKLIEKHAKQILEDQWNNLHPSLDVVGILIRMCVMITRLNSGSTIGEYKIVGELDLEGADFSFPLALMQSVCSDLQFPLLKDELSYIEGTYNLENNKIDFPRVTEQIIKYVSKKENIDYVKDKKLYIDLLNHLTLRFQKGDAYLIEKNPFTSRIKKNHFSLFTSISEASQQYFPNSIIIVQDSFISYIALHFLNAYEGLMKKRKTVRVLYVCATGRGAAKVIQKEIEKKINNLEFVGHCSLMEVESRCNEKKPDIIVSVFPIQSKIPVIVVEPIPTDNNIQSICEWVRELSQIKLNSIEGSLMLRKKNVEEQDHEDVSQEMIISGFTFMSEFLEAFSPYIVKERKKALILHIFLMIHRCYFEKQYEQNISVKNHHIKYFEEIRAVCKKCEIYLNEAEMIALSQYLI